MRGSSSTSFISCVICQRALDEVRRGEYKRLSGKDRSYIKGQRYTLLSRRENLSLDGRRALKKLLQANRRLNTAYILKEAFGQLWDYRTERGARAFFTRWKDSLKWQRLHPYQKFAGMIESHWDGIASYCHPENKVSLGLVEGVNNKIRVLQRRAYGYRDEEYLKLRSWRLSFRHYPEMQFSTHTNPRRPLKCSPPDPSGSRRHGRGNWMHEPDARCRAHR